MDELLDLERRQAARAFAKGDFELAYNLTAFVAQLPFDDGYRRGTVWSIDDTFVVVAVWAPGEQDPTFDVMVLP